MPRWSLGVHSYEDVRLGEQASLVFLGLAAMILGGKTVMKKVIPKFWR